MTLTAFHVEPYGLFDTIIVFHGRDEDGKVFRFAVDHRPAREVRRVIEGEGGELDCYVEDWQILGEVVAP